MKVKSNSVQSMRKRLLGTWKMLTWMRRLVESGHESDALGANPFGHIIYAPDGHIMVFVLRSDRPRPSSNPPSEKENVVEADRVVHTLTGSWNALWTGTQQTRCLSFEGDRLVYTTPETVDPIDGKLCTYKVTFERA